MANVYVRSGAAGAGTGADWANAYTTLALAIAKPIAAGDVLYVSEDHAESTAAGVTWTFPGTPASPNFIYCVNHLGSVPPVSADLRTTGAASLNGNFTLTLNGVFYMTGLLLTAGNGAGSNNINFGVASGNHWQYFKNCTLALAGSATARLAISNTGGATATPVKVVWDNCIASFAAAAQSIAIIGGLLEWRNTASAVAGAALPTTLFTNASPAGGGMAIVEGVDLSALGSGKTLVGNVPASQKYYFKDCKLGASVTVAATPTEPGAPDTFVVRSDSAATNYRSEKYAYAGTETTETTIVRTGGATDGATPQSRKLATTANSRWVLPFEALPIRIWNDVVSNNVTVTIRGTWNSGAVPNNDDIWLEVEYLGSSSNPQGSFANDTKSDNLAAGAALAADSISVWGGGGSSAGWSPFTMTVTLNSPQPLQRGYLYLYVKAAKASSTFYIDPQPQLG